MATASDVHHSVRHAVRAMLSKKDGKVGVRYEHKRFFQERQMVCQMARECSLADMSKMELEATNAKRR